MSDLEHHDYDVIVVQVVREDDTSSDDSEDFGDIEPRRRAIVRGKGLPSGGIVIILVDSPRR